MSVTTDVLVVGGGLIGCSTAYYLAKRGVRVTVVERREAPGRETTARSGAIIRAHYGVPELVTLAWEANQRYARFADEVGKPCGFVRCGYSVLVDSEDVETLRANVCMHQALGVHVSLIPPDHLGARAPWLKLHDVALVAWEPKGGYANPALTTSSYAAQAQALGAEFRFDSTVTAAERQSDSWRVTLENGDTISAARVVVCTGNWSRPVGALFGLELPVAPVRAQIVVLDRPEEGRGPMPVVSDLVNLAYYRQEENGGMWAGSSDMADLAEFLPAPEDYREAADAPAIDAAKRKATLRFEGMANPEVQRAFCGLYETTPDWQPIIDTFDASLHAAVGFSGHGFKLAPVVGDAMAARALGEVPPFDTSLFTLSRFAAGRPIKSRYTYKRARFLR
ncbi:oxidoreductase [Capsulimonas corticalis]|uniref:Oxidoreductase n=1 Tax=Capsulimonas corticalis TaxID=2219043 RepID=A0A402CPM1_9BACT|nr:FAD-dependent oxidoreductase [Capsulimonas corticalis]BDI32954.1 oxidoreductase [Capsulimonas corticalis]